MTVQLARVACLRGLGRGRVKGSATYFDDDYGVGVGGAGGASLAAAGAVGTTEAAVGASGAAVGASGAVGADGARSTPSMLVLGS